MLVTLAIVISISYNLAHACSCGRPDSIPKKIEATPVIFHGVVESQHWRGFPFFSEKKTTFKVLTAYKGDLGRKVIIYHERANGSNCGMGFRRKYEGLIFAYVTKSGEVRTSSCEFHSGYSDQQFIEFFENGFDSSKLDMFCSWEIEKAYSEQETSGKFIVDNEECRKLKPIHDKIFRNEK